jgi:hypothetical protein
MLLIAGCWLAANLRVRAQDACRQTMLAGVKASVDAAAGDCDQLARFWQISKGGADSSAGAGSGSGSASGSGASSGLDDPAASAGRKRKRDDADEAGPASKRPKVWS